MLVVVDVVDVEVEVVGLAAVGDAVSEQAALDAMARQMASPKSTSRYLGRVRPLTPPISQPPVNFV